MLFFLFLTVHSSCAQPKQKMWNSDYWPIIEKEAKPWTRWWWMGSAVNVEDISLQLNEFAEKGIGGVEITPIYGVKGEEENYIDFLSPKWMKMLSSTIDMANQLDMGVDMNTGTGWPFGGPYITNQYAAKKLKIHSLGDIAKKSIEVFIEQLDKDEELLVLTGVKQSGERINLLKQDRQLSYKGDKLREVYAATQLNTNQKVKRAAPGGEGLVFDHFSEDATHHYLSRFDAAFKNHELGIRCFFNDSYEVFGANSTSNLFSAFYRLKGYNLTLYLKELSGEGDPEIAARIKSDYREVLGLMLLENFTNSWTKWTHKKGAASRNQAHGSPANLIDLYSAVDIPEVETFHATSFPFLQNYIDTSDAKNTESNKLFKKMASSAAHLKGGKLVSSEIFTWLNEHFKTPLYQCKPELDELFTKGVNHVFFHGSTYSPKKANWPGWLFYASAHFEPNNPQWEHIGEMNSYIARCQSILQQGQHNNDFLVYWPIWDFLHNAEGLEKKLTLHNSEEWLHLPKIEQLLENAYDFDFITDRIIQQAEVENEQILTYGKVPYKTLVIPPCKRMPLSTFQKLLDFADKGATVIFNNLPESVSGYSNWKENEQQMQKLIRTLDFEMVGDLELAKYGKGVICLGEDMEECLHYAGVEPELLADSNIKYISRVTEKGTYYFVANHEKKDFEEWLPFKHSAENAIILNPINGKSGLAETRILNNKKQVRIQLKAGASMFVLMTNNDVSDLSNWKYIHEEKHIQLKGPWRLEFLNGGPVLPGMQTLDKLSYWSSINNKDCQNFSGLAKYTTHFSLNKKADSDYLLRFEEVQASVKVIVNGQDAGIIWSFPFELKIGAHLIDGENTIELEVASLAANRIRYLDQAHVNWKRFHNINFVNLDYKKFDASDWNLTPSGLNGNVEIITIKQTN